MADYKSKLKSRAKRKVKNKIKKSPVIITILLILLAVSMLFLYQHGDKLGISLFQDKQSTATVPAPSDGEVLFHFIDVGQGDAILITSKAGNMLIDTSESGERDKLSAYLTNAGIKSFKYVVFTHTDADHIGNADYIINNYSVENVLLPNFVHTSKTYDRMMDAIEEKKVNLILIGEGEDCEQAGYTFRLGSLQNTVLSPTKDYDDPNDMSIVIKAEYGDTSVMLTGDAEETPEADILAAWKASDLKSTILKVGHHGSSSSTTQAFLDAVDPDFAIISCGLDNKYGHPHDPVMERLNDKSVKIYRTDKDGNIVFKTDGKTFTYIE